MSFNVKSTSRVRWMGAAAFIALAAIPQINVGEYFEHVFCSALIFAIAALGMQLLLGFAGQLSIGQAAFVGIGAYASALLTTKLGIPFFIAFMLSGFISGVVSLLLIPIVRLRGVYLAVSTLGFGIIVHLVLQNEEWLTGGTFGIMNIPKPSLGPFIFSSEKSIYYLCLIVLAAIFVSLSLLVDGRFGRALRAIMQDEAAAKASGISPIRYKSKCFVIASVIAGWAGSLLAHHTNYLNPNDFTLWQSIEILTMVAIGGIGNFSGAVIGAFIVTLLPEFLRSAESYRTLIYGAILVAMMGFGSKGVVGLFQRLIDRGQSKFMAKTPQSKKKSQI
jgi:branched-chain amino acid transport system permease protein